MRERYTTRLQPTLWRALHDFASLPAEPANNPLFCAGELAQCIYLVEAGQVRLGLLSQSRGGQPYEIAQAGSVLGLSEGMSGEDYKLTAEAEKGGRISYINRDTLLWGLSNNRRLCLEIARFISEDLHSLYRQFHEIAGDTVPSKKHPASVRSPVCRFQL
jgi:CRP-like cAMP-binding protein